MTPTQAAATRRRLARHAVSEVRAAGSVRRVTLDRPEARNAMTPAMYFGIRYAIGLVEADDDLAGLLITGTGDVFAPGGDLGGGDGSDNWLTFGAALDMDVTPFETLRQSVKPVVSARSTGCVRAAGCRSRSAVTWRWSATARRSGCPNCSAASPTPTTARCWPALIGPVRTRDLMFTGRVLTAQEAVDWGMVARVVPHDELLDAAREVLTQCCRTAPGARGVVKSSLDNYLGLFDRIGMKASYSGDEAARVSSPSRSAARPTGCIPTCVPTAGSDRRAPMVHPFLNTECRLYSQSPCGR